MTPDPRPVLVVGGAGFIGSHLVDHLSRAGVRVRVYDDLSRAGAERNVSWLRRRHEHVQVTIGDVRDRDPLRAALAGTQAVFHLAAYVPPPGGAVDARTEFEVNAGGTVELLEALRRADAAPALVFASTSEIYGALDDVPLALDGDRWQPYDPALRACGYDERRPVQAQTSRAAADQYVLDYARAYGLRAVVLRLGSIYGRRQSGAEEQAWVARFLQRAIDGQPITIHGDGRQVRDVLYIDDLVEALEQAWGAIDALTGRPFNVGGGPAAAISERELVAMIEELRARRPDVVYRDERPDEPRYYVTDLRAFSTATGWRPRNLPRAGVTALLGWMLDQRTGRPQTFDDLGRIGSSVGPEA